MNRIFSSRHGSVMAEPVIAILFFAIISVFLLRMFAATEKMRSGAEETSNAVIRAESVAEYMLASKKEDGGMAEQGFRKMSADGRIFYVKYFDRDWNETEEVGKYMITVLIGEERQGNGKLVTYDVNVSEVNLFEKSGEIFSLTTKKYMGGCGSE